MCIMCIEIAKDKLTWCEADRNWGEVRPGVLAKDGPEHVKEVEAKLEDLKDREVDEFFMRDHADVMADMDALDQLGVDSLPGSLVEADAVFARITAALDGGTRPGMQAVDAVKTSAAIAVGTVPKAAKPNTDPVWLARNNNHGDE